MATRDIPRFGDLVRRHRTAAALSQEALAERAGVSARAISDLERGVHQAPHLETVRLLADALGLGEEDRAGLLAMARPEVDPPGATVPTLPAPLAVLPRPPTRLIGREAEMAALFDLLARDDVRLVTLTGPGGTGKTHLALAVAGEAMGRYPDGTGFVDLSPITDPDLAIPAIATEFGLREVSGTPLQETVIRHLRERRLLLVLDNCEQVLGAASDIAAQLAAGPHLTILATSREALHVRVERVFPVAPLPLPDPQPPADLAALAQEPTVALFVERAQAADPAFMLTEGNATAVAAICRRLDGLPLAIELAAVRVRLLPPESMLVRLEQSLPFLTGGARDAPERQRTLRNTIAWSHELLSLAEQALFRQLSVFVGGWTLEAADALAERNGEPDVLGGLSGLLDRHLIRRIESADDDARFAMFETIREFAAEQWTSGHDETVTRHRHAAYFVAFAEQAALVIQGPDQRRWRRRLESELPNLRETFAWLEQTDQDDQMLQLAGSLGDFWVHGGHLREGREWVERALARGGSASSRIAGLFAGAHGALIQADFSQAVAWAHEGLELVPESGDDRFEGRLLYILMTTAWMQGDVPLARLRAESAIARLRDLNDRTWLAWALSDMGTVMSVAGEPEQASRLSAEGLALHRELGNATGVAINLMDVGAIAHQAGDMAAAAKAYAESLAVWRDLGESWWSASALTGVADLASVLGRYEQAARLLGAAARLWEVSRGAAAPHGHVGGEVAAAAARSALGDAIFAREHATGWQMRTEEAIEEALHMTEAVIASQTDH
jgi:predicted ATPase/transcriptional regulator with XRE-family HTH domain